MKTHPSICAAAYLLATGASAQVPTLNVLTYDSFTSEWGPGPAIEAAFEAVCGCDLVFDGAGDGAALLARLQLEGPRSDADTVLGLDTNLTAVARATGLFAPHAVAADLDLPINWGDPDFLPFDWGYFAFVGNAGDPAPASLRALADSDLQIVIQDPRSSTPGLGLLMWVKTAYGDEAGALWADLADNIVTVTPGWSEAYGLFLEGEADAALSYTTSPDYHLIAEEDDSKIAWPFTEGHYMQVEVAGKLAATDQPELADQFMAFITNDAFQSVIPTTNWMYPAVTPEGGLPAGFDQLVVPDTALLLSAEDAADMRDAALAEWRAEFVSGLSSADWAALRFTIWQAVLSALISVVLAIPAARALARRRFRGRGLLITLLGAPFLLPVIVAVMGLLAVFGRSGLVNGAHGAVGLPPVSVYGLQGVVLAHVFFNLPLAIRLILRAGWLFRQNVSGWRHR